jgi:Ricin-type beta-trefoil lectin domain
MNARIANGTASRRRNRNRVKGVTTMTTNRVWVLMTQIKEQSMSPKTTLARIVGRSRPPSVSRTAPRRFGYVSVVIATVGAVLAIVLPAAPASAAGPGNGVWRVWNHSGQDPYHFFSPFCLDADASQAHAYGDILAWDCSNSNDDDYQDWEITYQGNGLYQLRNVGTLNVGTPTCLDFAANLVGYGGWNKVIQFTCNSSDPYQLFYITYVGNGNWSFKNLGASEAAPGTPGLCLDLNGSWNQYWDVDQIIAYPCDTNDGFQLWYLF